MEFSLPTLLTIGLPLVALPLVIHLINLRRHRRVEWAAMQFLLESQKKNRKWIVLQQLLLLLLRTAAVAAVVLMLAGPTLLSQWGRLLGQGSTHHVFLIDDSFSMTDESGDQTAFQRAKQSISNVLKQVAPEGVDQKVTFLPFSSAASLSAGGTPEISGQPLSDESLPELQAWLDQRQCSESSTGPSAAIRAAVRLPEPEADEARIVYLVSDFRSRQWATEELVKRQLRRLRSDCSQMHLVQCVENKQPNLSIVDLVPEAGIRAAGVETWFKLTVANHGEQAARSVSATILQDDHKLPSIVIDEIEPGAEVTRRFRVRFRDAGVHRLQANLENDAVKLDNTRYFACTVPPTFPVLIIDGSPARDDGFYLRTALQPGGTTSPGWSARIEPPSFLRQHDQLPGFAAICLLNVSRLDESEVMALQEYVETGGGLAVYLGSEAQRTFYNERLYRDGTGLLPAPLEVPTQLLHDPDQSEPDLVVTDHPLFRIYAGRRNSFLPLVRVNFYYSLEPGWRPSVETQTKILARLRNGAPFVVEKQSGEGRVILHLAKLSPKATDLGTWTNWGLNPVFPIYANELIGQLSAAERKTTSLEVGQSLAFHISETDYEPEFRVIPPQTIATQSKTFFPNAEEGSYAIDAGTGTSSGIWQFFLRPREDQQAQRLLAVNVDTDESDLDFLDRSQLAHQLRGIDYQFSLASQMSLDKQQLGGFHLSDSLLYLLAGVLILEQWLAYRASYHQPNSQPSSEVPA